MMEDPLSDSRVAMLLSAESEVNSATGLVERQVPTPRGSRGVEAHDSSSSHWRRASQGPQYAKLTVEGEDIPWDEPTPQEPRSSSKNSKDTWSRSGSKESRHTTPSGKRHHHHHHHHHHRGDHHRARQKVPEGLRSLDPELVERQDHEYNSLLTLASQLITEAEKEEATAGADSETDTEAETDKVPDITDRFQHISGAVIMLNTIVIGLEASYIEDSHMKPYFQCVELIFTAAYLLEIGVRLKSNGPHRFFITADDMVWNWFDFSITMTSVLDAFMQLRGQSGGSGASAGRLFRVLRILRLFRALRFLKELEIVLILAGKATLKLLALVTLVVIVSAIVTTNVLWDADDEEVARSFHCLGASMWSMFKLMTLDGWIDTVERITTTKPSMIIFFIAFIFFASIALMSLVPAIFIELNMIEKERNIQKAAHAKKKANTVLKKRMLQHLFRIVDIDYDGTASVTEMQRVLEDAHFAYALAQHGKHEDLMDMRLGVFTLLEAKLEQEAYPEKAHVTEEEFIEGVYDSWGDVDQAMIRRSITHTRQKVHDLHNFVKKEIEDLREEMARSSESSSVSSEGDSGEAIIEGCTEAFRHEAAAMQKKMDESFRQALREALAAGVPVAAAGAPASQPVEAPALPRAPEEAPAAKQTTEAKLPPREKSVAEVETKEPKANTDAVMVEVTPRTAFLVDNSKLQSPAPGLAYRVSKRLEDKCPGINQEWGTVIEAIDEGDGWIRYGVLYLPKDIGDVPVLRCVAPVVKMVDPLERKDGKEHGEGVEHQAPVIAVSADAFVFDPLGLALPARMKAEGLVSHEDRSRGMTSKGGSSEALIKDPDGLGG